MAAEVIPIPLHPQPAVRRSELQLVASGVRLQRGLALWFDVSNFGNAMSPEQLLAYPELTNDHAAVFSLNETGQNLRTMFVGLGLSRPHVIAAMDAVATNIHQRPVAYSCTLGELDRFNFIVLPFAYQPQFFVCVFEK